VSFEVLHAVVGPAPIPAIREITIDRRFRPELTFKLFDGTASAPPDFCFVVAQATSARVQQL